MVLRLESTTTNQTDREEQRTFFLSLSDFRFRFCFFCNVSNWKQPRHLLQNTFVFLGNRDNSGLLHKIQQGILVDKLSSEIMIFRITHLEYRKCSAELRIIKDLNDQLWILQRRWNDICTKFSQAPCNSVCYIFFTLQFQMSSQIDFFSCWMKKWTTFSYKLS